MLSDYEHDIFISYKRQTEWTQWARDRFCTQLGAYLQQDLGRPPRIFMDEQMLPGRDLPRDLGENLARSRVVIPLLSRDYFYSEWCVHELDLIYERHAEFLKATGGTQGIVVPIVVHDGELIPACIGSILYGDFSDFRRTVIARESQLAEDFSAAIKRLSPAVQAAVAAAPSFDSRWIVHHRNRFIELQAAGSKSIQTKNFVINRPTSPTSVPRPVMGVKHV